MEMSDILKRHFADVEVKIGNLPDDVKLALARLDEMEQKVARGSGGGSSVSYLPSAGQQFVDSEEVKHFSGNAVTGGRRISVETKAILSSITTDAAGSAGGLVVPWRDQLVGLPHRRLVVRDLLQVVPITSNAIQIPKLTAFTNNAATVSETSGATKPQSDMEIQLITANVTTIAHWMLATRQILDDAPQLQGLIDGEMRYQLAFVEDNALLNGTGTGTDLNGIYTQATASSTTAKVALPTKIDVIGMAILQQNLTYLPADGIVLNPSDFTAMKLTKATTGEYIIGDPQSQATPRLFGLPVVITPAMTAGKFLVGNFASATLYDRMSARVEISTEDASNFRQNLVTILCEERIAFAVKSALGFTKGDFAAQITALT